MRAWLLLIGILFGGYGFSAEVQFCPPFRAHVCARDMTLILSYCQETTTTVRIEIEYQSIASNMSKGTLKIDKGGNMVRASKDEYSEILYLLVEASRSDAFEKYDIGSNWLMEELKEALIEREVARKSTNAVSRNESDAVASEIESRFFADFRRSFYIKHNNCASQNLKHAIELAIKLLTVGVEGHIVPAKM